MFIEHEMQSLFYSKLIYMMTKKALSSYLFIKTVVWESFIINPVIGIVSLAIGTILMQQVPTIIYGDTLLVTVAGGRFSVA